MFSLLKLLNPRVILWIVGIALFALYSVTVYRAGRAVVAADWANERVRMAEEGAKEHGRLIEERNELQRRINDGDRKYQVAKADRAAAIAALAGSVQRLNAHYSAAAAEAAAAGDSAACRTDDPRPRIASECTAALAELGKAHGELADKTRALQNAAAVMCVTKP